MEASLNLRSHFLSRSAQLITPLARYLNTLIPSPTEVKHARKVFETSSSSRTTTTTTTTTPPQTNFGLRLKPFNPTNFFASLKTHGSILPFKSTRKKTEFYERCVCFLFPSSPDLLVIKKSFFCFFLFFLFFCFFLFFFVFFCFFFFFFFFMGMCYVLLCAKLVVKY